MRDDGGKPDEVNATWLDLVQEGFLLGLIRQLQERYPERNGDDIEDAVYEAVTKLGERLGKSSDVRDVRSYVAKVAYRVLARTAKRTQAREHPVEDVPESTTASSAEYEALRNAAVEVVKAEVRTWHNAHVREVTLAVIEAAASGEPIDDAELTEIVSGALGEELSVTSVRVWKSRGLRALRRFAVDAGLIDTRDDFDRKEEQ